MRIRTLYFLLILLFVSCSDYTPKPKGYSRIDKKEQELIHFQNAEFSFLYPSNSKVEYLVSQAKSEIWFNIVYPEYHATIYCTYVSTPKGDISALLEDSYKLAYSHTVKAEGISQSQFSDSLGNAVGLIYDIKGPVASPVQFYVTDNTSNFMRGSLYFDSVIKPDSIAPVVSYLREDIVNIIETFRWKRSNTGKQ